MVWIFTIVGVCLLHRPFYLIGSWLNTLTIAALLPSILVFRRFPIRLRTRISFYLDSPVIRHAYFIGDEVATVHSILNSLAQFGGQEPGTDEEISSFCTLNHGVTFPVRMSSFFRIRVLGPTNYSTADEEERRQWR